MKFALLISLLLAAVVVRSPKDAANQIPTSRTSLSVSNTVKGGQIPAPMASTPAAGISKTVYVTVSAVDEFGVESDWPGEAALPYTNNQLSVVWAPSPIIDLPIIDLVAYQFYWGTNSGDYRWSALVGTNNALSFAPVPVLPSTQYFKLFAQVSTNGLNSFTDASPSPFLTVTQVSGASGPPETLWRIRIAVTNSP